MTAQRTLSRRLVRLRLARLEGRSVPATFTVTNTLDAGAGSLRQAIGDANLSTDPTDTIAFSIGTGPVVIQPLSPLPAIGGATVIDGATQPGFAGKPLVVLDGQNAGAGVHGLQVTAADVAVRSLVIQQFKGDGIQAFGTVTNLSIKGCYVGTDLDGKLDLGNGGSGIAVFDTGPNPANVTIGGPAVADRNVVSGNNDQGVYIGGLSGVSGVIVENNFLGTDVTGKLDLGNGGSGVRIDNLAAGIGVIDNVASGNGGDGVAVSGSFNSLVGNVCGLSADGKAVINNSFSGIALFGGSSGNSVGGFDFADANVLSGNGTGLYCGNATTSGNYLSYNLVGTDPTGLLPFGNTFRGIWINDAPGNTVARCVVCATAGDGIVIDGTNGQFNRVRDSLIGVGVDGTTVMGNTNGGVNVFGGASFNQIGSGPKDPGPNVISGNIAFGVGLFDPGTANNFVAGNYIGTDEGVTLKIGNGGPGVAIDNGATDNSITNGDGPNTIAFNAGDGVSIAGAASLRNRVTFNSIFDNAGLGIDLAPDGPTANDPIDADTGPNGLQNFPVLTFTQGGATTKVAGTFNSLPNTNYRLDFYSSPSGDPSGFGEGQVVVGSLNVTTDALGDVTFAHTFFTFTPPGQVVTATAVDPDGSTSEFCLAKSAAAPTAPPCVEPTLVLVNFGDTQRSNVRFLSLAFDQEVTLPVTPESAFQLKRQSDGAIVTLTANTFNDVGRTFVNFAFSGPTTVAGSLLDGRYTLTAFAAKIFNSNGSLDGDCNGTAGDDSVLTGDPAVAPKLFRLFGDSNGDGDVDVQDFGAFRGAFGGPNTTFDSDGDGDVDAADFGQFRQRFGTSV